MLLFVHVDELGDITLCIALSKNKFSFKVFFTLVFHHDASSILSTNLQFSRTNPAFFGRNEVAITRNKRELKRFLRFRHTCLYAETTYVNLLSIFRFGVNFDRIVCFNFWSIVASKNIFIRTCRNDDGIIFCLNEVMKFSLGITFAQYNCAVELMTTLVTQHDTSIITGVYHELCCASTSCI